MPTFTLDPPIPMIKIRFDYWESNASPMFRERPGWFMEMLPHFVRNDRVIVFGKPSLRWHFASVQGFARMVAEADDSFS